MVKQNNLYKIDCNSRDNRSKAENSGYGGVNAVITEEALEHLTVATVIDRTTVATLMTTNVRLVT